MTSGVGDCSVVVQHLRMTILPSIAQPGIYRPTIRTGYMAARVSRAYISNLHTKQLVINAYQILKPAFTSHPTQCKTSGPSPPHPPRRSHDHHLLSPPYHLPPPAPSPQPRRLLPPPSPQPTTPSLPPSPVALHLPNPAAQSPHPTPAHSPGNGYETVRDHQGIRGIDSRSGGRGRGSRSGCGDGRRVRKREGRRWGVGKLKVVRRGEWEGGGGRRSRG